MFLVELIVLATALYFLLSREFKRLAKQRAFKKFFTAHFQAKFVSLQDTMMIGYSTEQAARPLKGLTKSFETKD
jgi:hypothetical protein